MQRFRHQQLFEVVLGLAIWIFSAIVFHLIHQAIAIENLALLLVLSAIISSFFLRAVVGMIASGIAVLAFNWFFVSPKYTFNVADYKDYLLLMTMLFTSWVTGTLVSKQRDALNEERKAKLKIAQLCEFAEKLNAINEPFTLIQEFADLLASSSSSAVCVELNSGCVGDHGAKTIHSTPLKVGQSTPGPDWMTRRRHGTADPAKTTAGQWHFLPLESGTETFGSVSLHRLAAYAFGQDTVFEKALCRQMATALQRNKVIFEAQQSEILAREQKTKTTLLAAIAHDFRTPLAAIMNAAESIQIHGDRLSLLEIAAINDIIFSEARQMHVTTENTLQLARLDNDAINVELQIESVEEIAGNLIQQCRRRGLADRVQIVMPNRFLLLRCNAPLVIQLLTNLVFNAVHHANAPSPICVSFSMSGNARLAIQVIDDGSGIPHEYHEKIFELFSRVGTKGSIPQDGVIRGFGLGLAVCKEIMRVHGGSIRYLDNPVGGSIFECHFPGAELMPVVDEV